MRDRLFELLKQRSCAYVMCDRECGECHNVEMYEDAIESIADYLLANGVIVPPCKVGDIVFYLYDDVDGTWDMSEIKLTDVGTKFVYASESYPPKDDVGFNISWQELGNNLFLTKAEAEKALAERSGT